MFWCVVCVSQRASTLTASRTCPCQCHRGAKLTIHSMFRSAFCSRGARGWRASRLGPSYTVLPLQTHGPLRSARR